ncbi:MAG: DUF4294 domain-containing protein [Bacteroidales bacterium]|nr:DUF4294 domain-containing protein [Bacteroidales bacterium]
MKKLFLTILVAIFCLTEVAFAQKDMDYYSEINVDSLIAANEYLIMLPEVKVYSNKRKAARAAKKYDKTVRNFKKVYPYALEVSAIYRQIDDSLARMDSERQRRQYMNMREDQIMAHYKPIMSKFTLSQAKMFVKLLDRECGSTAYEVIKTLKGGFFAGTCQLFASMFGNDLKKSYDSDISDKALEILVYQYRAGKLS